MVAAKPVFDLETTYVHLADGPAARAVEVDETFWAEIATRAELHEGRLVTLHRMAETWPHWEMHPAGDELVCLLSGVVDLVLEEPDGERTIELRGRAACIVPSGVWHRAIVHAPGEVLFVTRGAGTQHRPV